MGEEKLIKYKEYVKESLDYLTESLSEGLSGKNFDLSHIPEKNDKSFNDVFRGMKVLLDRLQSVKNDLLYLEKYNNIRADIWDIASREMCDENRMIQQLLNTVGPALNATKATFSRIDYNMGTGEVTTSWSKDGVQKAVGYTYPADLLMESGGSFNETPYLVFTPSTDMPSETKKMIDEIFDYFGISNMLVVPYGNRDIVEGVLTISDTDSKRIWKEEEIRIFLELVRIIKIRADQMSAEEKLKSLNLELEEKVEKQTEDLKNANDKLKLDIAELRIAEDALKESEDRFCAVSQTTRDAIISINKNYKILFWNSGAENMFGYTAEKIIGEDIKTILSENDRQNFLDKVKFYLTRKQSESEGGEVYEQMEKLLLLDGVSRDGNCFPVEISVASWGSMEQVFCTCVIRDISRRKNIEKQLANEKKLLLTTLESINEGVISVSREGNIMLINSSACLMTGWKRENAAGRNINTVVSLIRIDKQRNIDDIIRDVVNKKSKSGDEYILTNSFDGKEFKVQCRGVKMIDNDGIEMGAVIVFRNITEEKKAEEELFRVRKLDSLGMLAGGIAHDFNNILTSIVTNLFMVKTMLNHETEEYELVAEAEKAGFRATKLTNQLLTFSTGGSSLRETVSIKEMVEDSLGFCLSGSNVDYKITIPDDLWRIEIDRGQIDQVLNNLIINADQAMPEGGTIKVSAKNIEVSDDITITDTTEAYLPLNPGKYVKVAVSDQGFGIKPKNMAKIFDPYFTTKKDKAGLGLSAVYSIVKNHSGFITTKSTPGKGSTFIFYLPAMELKKEDENEEEDVNVIQRNVLVMDDEEVIRIVIRKLLKRRGYEGVCVSDGVEAILKYQEALEAGTPFDVVIMDLTVPGGMGGKEAVKKLREIDPGVKVIVASGYSNDPVLANYRDYGFKGVVSKPFNIDEFLNEIERVIENT